MNLHPTPMLYYFIHTAPQPPSQGSPSTAKDSNVCIIPNCSQPKFVESDGKVHPYCGKSHASLARQLGIFRERNGQSNIFYYLVVFCYCSYCR